VVVDTSSLPAEYTALANRLAADIRQLPPETVREIMLLLSKAANSREKSP
jgi:hypothetical protein